MKTRVVTVLNELGLHARPSAKIANTASGFSSSIQLATPQKSIDAKSIMQVMMLAAAKGTDITINAEGNDEEEALNAIANLFESHFGE